MSPKKKRRGSRACECPTCLRHSNSLTAELHRAINRFLSATNGAAVVSSRDASPASMGAVASLWWRRITGFSPHTIRRGRCELEQPSPTRRGRNPTQGHRTQTD